MSTISQNLQRLQTAKTDIATAITTMGGTVSSGDGFEDFASDISTIPTSSGSAAFLYVETTSAIVTVKKAGVSLSQTAISNETLIFDISEFGTYTVVATDGNKTLTETVSITQKKVYKLIMNIPYTYGITWNKNNSSTVLTRTDDSSSFNNPSPAISGGTGSSPFDNLYPWCGMTVKTFADGNVMIRIPKFYYKITNSNYSLSIQISTTSQSGFKVSPAHQKRYSWDIERDYVYIGKYKCNSSYKSISSQAPIVNITRSTARDGCRMQGTSSNIDGYYQQDFALFWTIRMLYIVEFADWNSQAVIGYGGGNGSSSVVTGTTNNMQYHTGTMKSSRTAYGTGVQYRNIEDPWGNVYEFVDGIYFNGSNIFIVYFPDNFSDSDNGVNIGTRLTSGGFISNLSTGSGDYDWAMYPSGNSGSQSTKIPDYCSYLYKTSGIFVTGGCFETNDQSDGLFFINGNLGNDALGNSIGTRLMYLPQNN